ncbi:MAG: hypothetical protein UT11_C0002G0006 [Berkelbacteria bacterium GW2011_GWA2_38_9]|uniref:Uncharacterized protein n=1 Tax=Berkelbacteria bacterium GW2011_GWA2_38_9 TaxID=1618334 RepID=A0A0G0LHU8_9BACT|nr:MAG: hypothetical protein UT11_C0002G0006 [Berkelbacteria bacterium GW2011_GWA2_38_9]
MAKKEYHHYQFIDPYSGQMPFSITMLIRYNKQSTNKENPICADDLILLDQELTDFDGNFKKIFSKSKN